MNSMNLKESKLFEDKQAIIQKSCQLKDTEY